MKLEVKNALGEIYYIGQVDEQQGWYHGQWSGYVTSEEVIDAVKLVMSEFDHQKFNKVLNDSSKGEGSWDEANEWLGQNWVPHAISNGLEKFAFIVSPDIFSAMSSEDLSTKIPDTAFEMRTFQSMTEAENWLKAN